MDDRVDLRAADHLCDERIADVGAHELGPAQVTPWWDRVDPDHTLDLGIGLQQGGEPAA